MLWLHCSPIACLGDQPGILFLGLTGVQLMLLLSSKHHNSCHPVDRSLKQQPDIGRSVALGCGGSGLLLSCRAAYSVLHLVGRQVSAALLVAAGPCTLS